VDGKWRASVAHSSPHASSRDRDEVAGSEPDGGDVMDPTMLGALIVVIVLFWTVAADAKF
jgi:hypothetical protein